MTYSFIGVAEPFGMTDAQFGQIDKMLNSIAWQYHGWYELSHDDLYQEGWVKAIEIINRYGFEYGAIASSFYNRIMDLGRHQKLRQNQISTDPLLFFSEMSGSYCDFNLQDVELNEDFYSRLDIHDMSNLFDDSKESKYFQMVAVYSDAVSGFELDGEETSFDFESSMNVELAEKMGYANSTSLGYRRIKNNVRNTIAKFLGMYRKVKDDRYKQKERNNLGSTTGKE